MKKLTPVLFFAYLFFSATGYSRTIIIDNQSDYQIRLTAEVSCLSDNPDLFSRCVWKLQNASKGIIIGIGETPIEISDTEKTLFSFYRIDLNGSSRNLWALSNAPSQVFSLLSAGRSGDLTNTSRSMNNLNSTSQTTLKAWGNLTLKPNSETTVLEVNYDSSEGFVFTEK